MYWRVLINIGFIVILSIIQISFISALPDWFNNINLIIVLLIFILSVRDFSMGLWWAFGSGIVMEVYSFSPFGVYLFSLVFATAFVNFLLVNFLTNRSLYSYLVLCFSAIFVYEFSLYMLNFLIYYFSNDSFVLNINKNFFLDKFSLFLINGLTMIVFFYIFNFVSKNFKPVFLINRTFKK